MIMRKKPLRGEKYILNGDEVTVLEVLQDGKGQNVSILLPSGKLSSCLLTELNLPVIDTKLYTKI